MATFTYNGISMSNYGVIVQEGPFLIGSPLESNEINYSVSDGSLVTVARFPSKKIELNCLVRATTHSGLLSYLDSIFKTISTREDKPLTVSTYTDRYWNCRVGDFSIDKNSSKSAVVNISFLATDPFAYANSVSTDIGNTSTHTITSNGTAEAFPTITLTTTGNCSIENETSDEKLTYVGGTNTLTVYCARNSLFVADENGDSLMSNLTELDFPRILPGINTFVATNCVADYSWRDRYL